MCDTKIVGGIAFPKQMLEMVSPKACIFQHKYIFTWQRYVSKTSCNDKIVTNEFIVIIVMTNLPQEENCSHERYNMW